MNKIEISLDELRYLKQKHKEANEMLSKYYDINKLREEIEYLMKNE
jgi:hypothetical protein